ncbi:MAG TPA: flavoprotein [Bdellovibrionota bacterium]|jgi:phosphopantothenoylcysteine decarboxylase/phosphopantothenate--cysteine ligase|nr:flavoprotein [Bdellovibrionota bacterium]
MKILVGLSGSIATYRSPDFVKALVARGHQVRVALTASASNFVGVKSLETFAGSKPYTHDHFDPEHLGTDHIDVARWADAMVMYGATANSLGKWANGLADDFLSTQYLAFRGPVVIAAAMNPQMWAHPAVKANVAKLQNYGNRFCGPIAGVVACGEEGIGHIASIEDIVAMVEAARS